MEAILERRLPYGQAFIWAWRIADCTVYKTGGVRSADVLEIGRSLGQARRDGPSGNFSPGASKILSIIFSLHTLYYLIFRLKLNTSLLSY
jgi:hypothetical protein